MYYSPSGDNQGGTYPWVYYQLGGNNEQLAVYNGFSLSDPYFWTSPTTVCAQPSPPRTAFLYPVEYNSYGAGSTIDFSYCVDENGVWRKDYSIRDHLGDVRMVLRKNTNDNNYVVSSAFDYKPFGERINVDVSLDNINRTGFIAKEKDNESQLGDFGVRKYEDNFGRFTSIDKLYEKHKGWSPYNYCMNNPISLLDDNGNEPQSDSEKPGYTTSNVGVTSAASIWNAIIQPIDDAKVFVMNLANRLTLGVFNIEPRGLDGDLKTSGEIRNASMNTFAQIGLTVLGGAVLNLTKVEQASKVVNEFISSAGKLTRSKTGALTGEIKGNVKQILSDLTKDGVELKSGAYRLKDGSYVHYHNSNKNGHSISITKGNKYYKIRVTE